MFIRSVILENYRIYYGRNALQFPRVPDKNLHIVSGNNGFGKTTLLSSLMWCLYGKFMQDVDETIKREVHEAGGYRRYAFSNLNRLAKSEGADHYSVTIVLSDIEIPPVPCKEVRVIRTFSTFKGEENLEILIDGQANELTKQVGDAVFINDFILPREIAKFFFFDAEKIVSLAEMRSLQERKNLSRAYSEVLGIKKYIDLKESLEDLRLRFRRNSATKKDESQYDLLHNDISVLKETVRTSLAEIAKLEEEKVEKRHASEQLQERLIREGNSLTIDGLRQLRAQKKELGEKVESLKLRMREMMELAPFVVAGRLMAGAKTQLDHEKKTAGPQFDDSYVDVRIKKILRALEKYRRDTRVPTKLAKGYSRVVRELIAESFKSNHDVRRDKSILHDFSGEQEHHFLTIHRSITTSFSPAFRELVRDYRVSRTALNKVTRLLNEAESKEDDLLIKEIRLQKDVLDQDVDIIEARIAVLNQDIGGLQRDIAVKSKLLAELGSRIDLGVADKAKDETAQRLISELEDFIITLKSQKKQALELRIYDELGRLFHKADFISKVTVDVGNDLIEVNLFNSRDELIPKESLSKGEQQLYATALLKALVDESRIRFPVFIDSPLQKFDKKHSRNIIAEFYPTISDQVVLFPLLEKELTFDEFEVLLPTISNTYLITNIDKDRSTFQEVKTSELFAAYDGPAVTR